MSKFPILENDYSLKGCKSSPVLAHFPSGSRFDLEEGQFEFLSMCDGRHISEEILNQYDDESCSVAREFLDNLTRRNIIRLMDEPSWRKLPTELPPDIGLQAVHLEARSGCNLRCAHCYQEKIYPESENLTFIEIERIAKEMQELLVQGVSVSGGEPFLQKDMYPMMKLFEDREIRIISIFTNGILLDEEKVENILRLRSRPTVFVSLDSITSEGMQFRGLTKAVTAEKTLARILRNIQMLATKGVQVVVNTVMHRLNIGDLFRMYEILRNLGVRSWRIGYPKETGFFKDGTEKFGLSWDVMANAYTQISQYFIHPEQI